MQDIEYTDRCRALVKDATRINQLTGRPVTLFGKDFDWLQSGGIVVSNIDQSFRLRANGVPVLRGGRKTGSRKKRPPDRQLFD